MHGYKINALAADGEAEIKWARLWGARHRTKRHARESCHDDSSGFPSNAWLVDTIPAINTVYAVKRPRIPKQRYLTHSFNHSVKENYRNKKPKIQNIAWRTPMTSIVNLVCQSNWGFSFQNPSPDLWVMPVVLKTIKRHVFIMSRCSFICVLKSGIRAGVACWCSGWELGPPSKEVLDLISDSGTFCEGLEICIC